MDKQLILTMGVAICLGLSVGCQRTTQLSEADRTAIRQQDENSAKAMNAKDWKAAAAVYAEDATEMPPNRGPIQGKAAIQAWLEAFPPFSGFQTQSLEVEGQEGLAYDRGTYSLTLATGSREPIRDHGKYLTVWRKQTDGSWKILRDIFSSDLAQAAPEKPAAPAKKASGKKRSAKK